MANRGGFQRLFGVGLLAEDFQQRYEVDAIRKVLRDVLDVDESLLQLLIHPSRENLDYRLVIWDMHGGQGKRR